LHINKHEEQKQHGKRTSLKKMLIYVVVSYSICFQQLVNIIQLLHALKVNIIIVHPRGVVFPRENNIITMNNYDVHRKCRESLFYYTETLFTIMLDAINTYLCVFILCFHKLHICVFNFRSRL
jgi:hypothetical protein